VLGNAFQGDRIAPESESVFDGLPRANGIVKTDGEFAGGAIRDVGFHTNDIWDMLGNGVSLHLGIAGIQNNALDVPRTQLEQVGEGVGRNLESLPLIVLHQDAVISFPVAGEMDYLRRTV
jgi:hypothetical protein